VAIVTVVVIAFLGACDGGKPSVSLPSTTIGWTPTTACAAPDLHPARREDRWGYIDRTGQVVIDFQYEEARAFYEGLAAVCTDGQWGYIDAQGTVVVPCRYQDAGRFSEGLAPVQAAYRWGYIDAAGTMVIPPQFRYAFWFSSARAMVWTDSGIGYIDKTGALVIPPDPNWQEPFFFSEGLAPVWFREGGYGYIDTSGNLMLSRWHYAGDFSEGLAAVESAGGYGYIDRSGAWVIEPQFYGATAFSNGLAVVQPDLDHYGIIDRTGRVVKQLDYDQVTGFCEGRAQVMIWTGDEPGISGEGWWGYMDESGELVIPARFKLTDDFRGGLAQVEDENGKMAYIDPEGNCVWREW
jgi:hypothetical protein